MPIPVRLTALRMRELSAPSSPDSHTSSPTKEKQNWESQPFQHPFSPVPSTTYFHPVDKKPVCSACVWEKWGSVKTKRAPSAIPSWMVWLDKYLIPSAQSHQEVLAVWERAGQRVELGRGFLPLFDFWSPWILLSLFPLDFCQVKMSPWQISWKDIMLEGCAQRRYPLPLFFQLCFLHGSLFQVLRAFRYSPGRLHAGRGLWEGCRKYVLKILSSLWPKSH